MSYWCQKWRKKNKMGGHRLRFGDYMPGRTSKSEREIIKVREWIPNIDPLTKVILLKLFLDIVPSSSKDVTFAMLGQPKRLPRSYRRRNGGNAIVCVLISFHSTDVLCTLSRLFVLPGFRLFYVHLTVHFLASYWILGSSIKQSLTATTTSTMAVYWACVIILCSFLCRCLQKVTKQQCEKATFLTFERTWSWTVRAQFLKFLFLNLSLSYIPFGIFLTV